MNKFFQHAGLLHQHLHLLNPELQSILRLHRHEPRRHNLLLPHRQPPLKRPHETRHQRPQLSHRKTLPNAAPRPVEKRQLRVVVQRPADPVRAPVRIDPALRPELARVGPPVRGRPVDGPRHEVDDGAGRDDVAGDGGRAHGSAGHDGDRRVEARDFAAHGVEVGQVFEGVGEARREVCRVGSAGGEPGGEVGADFVAEAGLDGRVRGEEVAAPGEGRGGGFVAGAGC